MFGKIIQHFYGHRKRTIRTSKKLHIEASFPSCWVGKWEKLTFVWKQQEQPPANQWLFYLCIKRHTAVIMFNTIVGFGETAKPSLKAHFCKIVPLKNCMEKAHEKMLVFFVISTLKMFVILKNGTECLRITCNHSTVLWRCAAFSRLSVRPGCYGGGVAVLLPTKLLVESIKILPNPKWRSEETDKKTAGGNTLFCTPLVSSGSMHKLMQIAGWNQHK